MTMQIGIIEGGGTGVELAEVFRRAVATMAEPHGLKPQFTIHDHRMRTYSGIHLAEPSVIAKSVEEDVASMQRFFEAFHDRGGHAVFRTAVNAQALYVLRRRLKAVKVVPLHIKGKNLLFVRDEIQGYYANETAAIGEDEVRFEGRFRKEALAQVLECAKASAARFGMTDAEKMLIYKHHLFGNRLEQWTRSLTPDANIYQPDTGIHNLMQYLANPEHDLVLVVSNEVGDILLEAIALHLVLGTKETIYTRNLYLDESVAPMAVYQTMHGSADDLAGKDSVNPIATLRAAAAMLEHEFDVSNAIQRMEHAIRENEERGKLPLGLAGPLETRRAVNDILAALPAAAPGAA